MPGLSSDLTRVENNISPKSSLLGIEITQVSIMPRFYVCSQLGRKGTNFFSAFLSVSLPQIFMSENNFMGLTRRMDSLRRRVSQPDSALITFV